MNEYYYVSAMGPGPSISAWVLEQIPSDNGFNFTEAHKYLAAVMGATWIIVGYQKTTKHRHDEFWNHVNSQRSKEPKKQHLVLVKGPNDEPPNSPA